MMRQMSVKCVVMALLLFIGQTGFSQPQDFPYPYKVLAQFVLPVSESKTTSLLFPFAIKSASLGSDEVIAQIGRGAENILQVKAVRPQFRSTNLSVITSDGRFFPFQLVYEEDPYELNISFSESDNTPAKVVLQRTLLDDGLLDSIAEQVDQEPAFLHPSTRQQGIRLMLEGLHLYRESLWFSLKVFNRTWINYEPESIRFFIQDRKRSKRTAVQEKEITPIFLSKEIGTAGGNATKLVMAFPVFTVPKSQQLVIRMAEKGGGRNLSLIIRPKTILKARPLPEQ